MKIALVLLPSWSTRTAPLGLASVAAFLKRAGHEVKCFDFNVRLWRKFSHINNDPWNYADYLDWQMPSRFEKKLFPLMGPAIEEMMKEVADWGPELAGFSIYATGLPCTRRGAAILRRLLPQIKIVYGGPEVTRRELETNREFERGLIDIAVIGEGEGTIVDLVQRLEAGQPLTGCLGTAYRDDGGNVIYEGTRPNLNLEDLPPPDFSDFDFSNYEVNALPVMMSRGCVAKCTFCAETRFWSKFRYRSANSVFAEFMNNVNKYGISNFEMADSLINGNFKVLEELTDLLIAAPHKIVWGGYARLDDRMSPRLLAKLAKSGLNFLNFGLETGSQKIMDLMLKQTTVEAASRIVRHSHMFGIMVSLNIIVGFPGETEEDFQKTIEFIDKHKEAIYVVSTGDTLGVTRGTPLELHPERYGIKAGPDGRAWLDENDDWISEDGTSTLSTRMERLRRFQNYLDDEKIFWVPSGNNPKPAPAPVDIDAVLANIDASV